MSPEPGLSEALRASPRALRGAALRGAVVASSLLITIAALRHHLDEWLIVGALVAIVASAILVVDGSRDRTEQARARVIAGDRPPAIADALLANIPAPVILVDRREVVIEANEAARSLFPTLKARHPLSFALRSPDLLDGIGEVLRTGEPLKVEYAERLPTERTFEVQITALRPAEAGDQTPPSIMLFFRDLTSARRLEHMRVDFVANASHELRTPLASLLGFIETLQGSARNDPIARERFLEIMREQAQRMTRLIDDLLSLSRIELRAHVPPETPVDLGPIVRHMIDTLSPLGRERGVRIELAAPSEPLLILGDRDELIRVVENVVENAVKYGESGGKVDIGLRRVDLDDGRGPQIEFTVRDYGPGIAAEHVPRLTERFYRVDVAESRQKGGTGLGLAIVKHIVNRHRGRLLVESEPGHGATFRVLFAEISDATAGTRS